jgi:hypothetical protein
MTRFDLPVLGVGENRLRFSLRNEARAWLELEALLATRVAGKDDQVLRVPLARLPGGKYVRHELRFRLDRAGETDVVLQVRDARTGEVLASAVRLGLRVARPVGFEGPHYVTRGDKAFFGLRLGLSDAGLAGTSIRLVLKLRGEPDVLGRLDLNSLKGRRALVSVGVKDLPPSIYMLGGAASTAEGPAGSGVHVFAVFPHFLAGDADGR